MQYKLMFEIAAFILLVVVLLHFYRVRQFPNCKAQVFLAFIWVSIAESVFYIVSEMGLANAQFVHQRVNELLAFAFFIIKSGLALALFMQKPDRQMNNMTNPGNEDALRLVLRQKMEKKKPLVIYSVEIIKFYQLQKLLGEETSEMLLTEIGTYLLNLSSDCQVFHRRNESFTIVLEQESDKECLLETLRERFSDVWRIRGNCILVDTMISRQHYPADFKDLSEFFWMHEYLLEQAAEQGLHVIENNRIFVEQYQRRRKVELALLKAVEKRSFEVYFQPIYSLKEKKIVSLEAMVRMKDEELGCILPDEFIPLAEKHGIMIAIDEIVLENCCRFLAKHILSNDSLGIRTIQVNVSGAQCMQQNLKERILPVLERYHIPPSMITLEVKERMAGVAPEPILRHMKELGIEFAADGYGTGDSNSSSLVKLPFREIKIDKSMTKAYFEDETTRIILENEIRTMQKLGISVVVVGIETEEQSKAMEALGVNYIQGYYYGKPMPEKECLVYIRKFYDER